MYAVIYSDGPCCEAHRLGADVKMRNDAGATALLWGRRDFEKTRVLVEHGADVMRDPTTAGRRSSWRRGTPDRRRSSSFAGARRQPEPERRNGRTRTPLREAATVGDADIMRLLIDAGSSMPVAGAGASCRPGADARNASSVADRLDPRAYTPQSSTWWPTTWTMRSTCWRGDQRQPA